MTFRLIDESERVREMAELAFVGPRKGRPAALIQLRDFSPPACTAAEDALWNSGEPGLAITAAVDEYRRQRQLAIAYRRRLGLPTEET
jgi:hypothetical protein